jgi:hypothetical protein
VVGGLEDRVHGVPAGADGQVGHRGGRRPGRRPRPPRRRRS